ncbi:MAG: aminodeoxychorismate/anthranilate synthase component II [Saprospiraceae bacterium]|nr:MAG: aminodeoxychorismate/anthranilate synthase component II [Saprospiraceae bacterium]
MKILVLDNYDSFTYNLVHYVEEVAGERPDVFRNDEITVETAALYDKILLSPGPGLPAASGILCTFIRELAPVKSIFGVCLGLQAMAEVFGGRLDHLGQVFHGVATPVHVRKPDELLFREVPQTFMAGRYHSWVVSPKNLPDCFDLTCEDDEGQIMGLSHKVYDLRGVQFHPESVMTEYGKVMLKNWVFN